MGGVGAFTERKGRYARPVQLRTIEATRYVTARFHWLVAPSSTIVQPSAVHTGLCDEPKAELDKLFRTLVELP